MNYLAMQTKFDWNSPLDKAYEPFLNDAEEIFIVDIDDGTDRIDIQAVYQLYLLNTYNKYENITGTGFENIVNMFCALFDNDAAFMTVNNPNKHTQNEYTYLLNMCDVMLQDDTLNETERKVVERLMFKISNNLEQHVFGDNNSKEQKYRIYAIPQNIDVNTLNCSSHAIFDLSTHTTELIDIEEYDEEIHTMDYDKPSIAKTLIDPTGRLDYNDLKLLLSVDLVEHDLIEYNGTLYYT